MLNRIFPIVTWVDGFLALVLGLLLLALPTPYRTLVPRSVYHGALGAGFVFCITWWLLFVYGFFVRPGTGEAVAVLAWVVLPATLLGVGVGLLGFIEFSKPWGW